MFFPLVRLKRFNQAEILALFECIAIKAAPSGELLTEEQFHSWLEKALARHGDELYRVAGRHGQEGYLSFRRQST